MHIKSEAQRFKFSTPLQKTLANLRLKSIWCSWAFNLETSFSVFYFNLARCLLPRILPCRLRNIRYLSSCVATYEAVNNKENNNRVPCGTPIFMSFYHFQQQLEVDHVRDQEIHRVSFCLYLSCLVPAVNFCTTSCAAFFLRITQNWFGCKCLTFFSCSRNTFDFIITILAIRSSALTNLVFNSFVIIFITLHLLLIIFVLFEFLQFLFQFFVSIDVVLFFELFLLFVLFPYCVFMWPILRVTFFSLVFVINKSLLTATEDYTDSRPFQGKKLH